MCQDQFANDLVLFTLGHLIRGSSGTIECSPIPDDLNLLESRSFRKCYFYFYLPFLLSVAVCDTDIKEKLKNRLVSNVGRNNNGIFYRRYASLNMSCMSTIRIRVLVHL